MVDRGRAIALFALCALVVASAWSSCQCADTDGSTPVPGMQAPTGLCTMTPARTRPATRLGVRDQDASDSNPDAAVADANVYDIPPPYDGAVACPWPGWYVSPRMPPGCNGLCIPDDPAVRLPQLNWISREDWCAGCKTLDTPWVNDPIWHAAVGGGVMGYGAQPDLVSIDIIFDPAASSAIAVYGADGVAKLGLREDYNAGCGLVGAVFSLDDLALGHYRASDYGATELIVPVSEVSTLATSTATTISWPASFMGQRSQTPSRSPRP